MKNIYFEKVGSIGTIILNTPPKNIIYIDTIREIGNVVCNIEKYDIKALFIRSKGRHFSAGADIEELQKRIHSSMKLNSDGVVGYEQFKEFYEIFYQLHKLKIPVICCLNGLCIGSGFELALSCHIRLCTQSALLGFPEATLGYLPALGGISRCADIISKNKMFEMILGGQFYSASEMLGHGLLDKLIEKTEMIHYCEQLSECISSHDEICTREQILSYL